MHRHLAILIAAAWPLAPLAETPAPPTDGEPAATTAPVAVSPPPVPPSVALTPPVTPAPPRPGVTIDAGGWLATGAFAGLGALDAADLPRSASRPVGSTWPRGERTFGVSVRQSRLRAALGLPSDGLLAGARLQGLVEVDFTGGYTGGDAAMPLLRLRHAYVSVAWEERVHLTLLAGQTWGLMGGPGAPESLARLAEPRFAGAGLLYRRAPQLRATAELGGALAVQLQGAVLAPLDRNTAPVPSKGSPTGVGVRSGLPDVEGRAALVWRSGGRRLLEVGVSGHAGRQTYWLDGLIGQPNGSVDSWGGAVDVRLELPRLTLLGGGFAGKNLGVCNTIGNGVTPGFDLSTGRLLAITGVQTAGAWGQAQLAAAPGLVLLLGGGLEAPSRRDLPASTPDNLVVWRNVQASAGALLDLTSRWRAGLEVTGYWTRSTAAGDSRARATQLELSTLYAF